MKCNAFKPTGKPLRRIDRLSRDLNALCTVSPNSTLSKSVHCAPQADIMRTRKRARYSLEPSQASAASAYQQRFEDDSEDAEELKAQLLDSLYGLERGFNAKGEIKGEISELILKLEAINPTPEPNQASKLLNGMWKLVYTANSELLPLLALNRLPGVTVGDIVQEIQQGSSVLNKVVLSGPIFTTSFSAKAVLEVSSPKRLGVTFKEGSIATPKLIDDLDFPSSASVLGQAVDLTRLKEAIQPLQTTFRNAAQQALALLDQSQGLSFPIRGMQANSWLLTTYLDHDLRISRGDGGSIFVLVKE